MAKVVEVDHEKSMRLEAMRLENLIHQESIELIKAQAKNEFAKAELFKEIKKALLEMVKDTVVTINK